MPRQLPTQARSMDVFSYVVFSALQRLRKLDGVIVACFLLVVAIAIVIQGIAGPIRQTRLPTMFGSEGIPLGRTPFDADFHRAAVPGSGPQWTRIVADARKIPDPFHRAEFIHRAALSSVS